MSGTATADEINRGLRTGKKRSFWRIASLTFLGPLMAVGLFVALAPMPAHADNDKDKHEDNDKDIRAEIAALQAQVTDLQKQVNGLQTKNTTLETQLAAVQSNHALLLGPFVNVDPNPEIGVKGPNIIFSGANIHIVSGSGSTDDNLSNGGSLTGLGNLIIGYDEDRSKIGGVAGFGHPPPGPPIKPGERGGSHNLVIGRANRFTLYTFGGLVAGQNNTIANYAASVSGGDNNTASGAAASVSGGQFGNASNDLASISGGEDNSASGFAASVSGGLFNTASGFFDSVLGGQNNTASGFGFNRVVVGGINNSASASGSVVIGGTGVTNNKENSIAPQPPFP